jgi:steroid delta-isomerase-like uncharacterized protein
MNHGEAIELMERHTAAWNAHDVDALLALMTHDCIFDAAAGTAAHGRRHVGHDALRAAFLAIFKAFPDARWDEAVHFASGDRGGSAWIFRGAGLDGRAVEVRGIDLLGFRDGRICHKDTYRKEVAAS